MASTRPPARMGPPVERTYDGKKRARCRFCIAPRVLASAVRGVGLARSDEPPWFDRPRACFEVEGSVVVGNPCLLHSHPLFFAGGRAMWMAYWRHGEGTVFLGQGLGIRP